MNLECNECNNDLDNTECRVISQVEAEAKPESEVCGAKPGRSASSSAMNTHLANIQGFKCKCSVASGMGPLLRFTVFAASTPFCSGE